MVQRRRSNAAAVSQTPYVGTKKYSYHDKNGNVQYVYSRQNPKSMEMIMGIVTLMPMLILLTASSIFFPFFISGFQNFGPVTPLTPVYTSADSHIEDFLGIIDNTDSLERTLRDFQELTGVEPYIVILPDSVYKDSSNTLEDLADQVYTANFEDDQHFLIVYAEAEDAADMNGATGEFYCKRGAEASSVIRTHISTFEGDLRRNLAKTSVSVGESFETAFSNSLGYIMERTKDDKILGVMTLIPFLFLVIVFLSLITNAVRSFIHASRDYEEVPEINRD